MPLKASLSYSFILLGLPVCCFLVSMAKLIVASDFEGLFPGFRSSLISLHLQLFVKEGEDCITVEKATTLAMNKNPEI